MHSRRSGDVQPTTYDPDVRVALAAAIEAGVPRPKIDRLLVEAATIEPDDEFRLVILAGRLFALACAQRPVGSKT